jgi:RNA polymerase sigma factor (sigma-70 family)
MKKRMIEPEREALFAECIEQHGAMFRKVAYSFADGAEQEDLLQEILLSIWKALPDYYSKAKLSTFTYRVAYNCALTWNRGRRRYRERQYTAIELWQLKQHETTQRDPRLSLLFECLKTLPEIDRSVMTMSLDGLSHNEIGNIIGLKENAVSVRIHRIRQKLETKMQQRSKQ